LVDGPELTTQITQITDGAPIALAIDAVGGESFTKLMAALSFGGTIVCYGALSMTQPELSSRAVIFNDIRVRGFWLAKWFENASAEEKNAAFKEVIGLIAAGNLKARIHATFSFDQIQEAVETAMRGGRKGKVLLVADDI
ncbi:MAG: zinc-binding dehydrogenase, partial [Alphaproteobacteria bacterium]|nr:zinc-binding dehydrogenase [Alphaproteobacteria bacterium]